MNKYDNSNLLKNLISLHQKGQLKRTEIIQRNPLLQKPFCAESRKSIKISKASKISTSGLNINHLLKRYRKIISFKLEEVYDMHLFMRG